jgi:iron complex outermembrane receptor protein
LNKSDVFRQIIDLQQDLYKSWKLYAKIQWDNEKVSSSNYDSSTTSSPKRNILSLYAAVDGKIYKDLDLRMTLRNDIVDDKSVGLFPTATLTYRMPFVKGLSFNAGYSHNYRNPTLNDLYWNPGGNENLKGENGKTVDFDINYLYENLNFNLDLRTGFYYSKVKDWIQWVPTTYRYWMPKNVSEVMARGAEFHVKANYRYSLWNFTISGNYVYSHTTDESEYAQQYDSDGKQLIYIPKHHANAFAEVRWKTWNLNYTFEFTGKRTTSMNDDDFFAYDLPYYTLHHISLGKQLNKFRLEFRINNLTDNDYQTVLWRAMPGRSYEVYLEFKL